MGNVFVVVKLYPEEPAAAKGIEEALKTLKSGKVRDIKRAPIAFGLELVRAGIEVPDKAEGIMEKLEKELKGIAGVKDVEVEGATLI